ncbi:hypothetical protein F4780DRAFT_651259 [Xylariomycetidae sp. FL0641]|nr:hypothetical protein F4780DRAFT_651259 [Xylariomycetidae sp. FL0641]
MSSGHPIFPRVIGVGVLSLGHPGLGAWLRGMVKGGKGASCVPTLRFETCLDESELKYASTCFYHCKFGLTT